MPPFNAEVDRVVQADQEAAGFEAVAIEGTATPSLPAICETPLEEIRALFRRLAKSDCDAILQVGTALPVVALIEELERDLGKPIVACNAAVYWQALRPIGRGSDPRLRPPAPGSLKVRRVRVAVIGGGAVGASILYHLTQAGVGDCLLLENEPTSGSTWHAAGNIPTYANTWLSMRAGNYAWSLYKELGDRVVDSAITYRHTSTFWPAHSEARMEIFRHLVRVAKTAGLALSMITPAEMEARHPFYRAATGILGGILDPYEGDIDPSQQTQALATGARQGGAEVARFTRVIGLSQTASGGWSIETDKGHIEAGIVANAAGFYGAQIAALAGSPLPIAVLEHQYLVTEPIPALAENPDLFPLVRDPDIRFYLRRERDSLLFGSYGHEGRAA